MRKAVNYAITGPCSTGPRPRRRPHHGQAPPARLPGFRSEDDPDTPDLRTPARSRTGSPAIPCDAVKYYESAGAIGPPQAQALHDELLQIGINASMVGFVGFNLYTALGHHGEPFDIGIARHEPTPMPMSKGSPWCPSAV